MKKIKKHESLIVFDNITRELMEMSSIPQVKDSMDKFKTLGIYFHQQNASLEIQKELAEKYLIAMRRMGEILIEMSASGERHTGGRVSMYDSLNMKSLKELGISRNLSSQCQKIASITEKEFYIKMISARSYKNPLSKRALLNFADKNEGKQKPKRDSNIASKDGGKQMSSTMTVTDKTINKSSAIKVETDVARLAVEIEESGFILLEKYSELVKCEKKVGRDAFNKEIEGCSESMSTVSSLTYYLSDTIEEIIDLIPPPNY
jgi:hypothetical protein